jgi:hypothetical protein
MIIHRELANELHIKSLEIHDINFLEYIAGYNIGGTSAYLKRNRQKNLFLVLRYNDIYENKSYVDYYEWPGNEIDFRYISGHMDFYSKDSIADLFEFINSFRDLPSEIYGLE